MAIAKRIIVPVETITYNNETFIDLRLTIREAQAIVALDGRIAGERHERSPRTLFHGITSVLDEELIGNKNPFSVESKNGYHGIYLTAKSP